MAREYWYMQLRSWLMWSSMESLIRCVLSGQKRLLIPGKTGAEEDARREHTEFRPCYKVAPFVVARVNTASVDTPGRYPFFRGLHLRSPGDAARVRRPESCRLGLGDVRGGRGVRPVEAGEHDEIAGVEAREVL